MVNKRGLPIGPTWLIRTLDLRHVCKVCKLRNLFKFFKRGSLLRSDWTVGDDCGKRSVFPSPNPRRDGPWQPGHRRDSFAKDSSTYARKGQEMHLPTTEHILLCTAAFLVTIWQRQFGWLGWLADCTILSLWLSVGINLHRQKQPNKGHPFVFKTFRRWLVLHLQAT